MVTAVLGALIFSESLPGLWWLGAALLVAGSVIIGRREEGKESGNAGTAGAEPTVIATGQDGEEPDAPIAGAGKYRDSVELTNQGPDEDEDELR